MCVQPFKFQFLFRALCVLISLETYYLSLSLGYYMYIETSSPRVPGDNAKLKSPSLKFSGNMCLSFYYHMYGLGIGSLKVSINGQEVFSRSGNKGNAWLKASVTISSIVGSHQVRDSSLGKTVYCKW